MMPFVDQASRALLSELILSAARSLVIAGVAGVGLAAFRTKASSLRLFTWTAVLYASLVASLLGWMLPPLQIPAPEFLHLRAGHPMPRSSVPSDHFSSVAHVVITTTRNSASTSGSALLASAAPVTEQSAHPASRSVVPSPSVTLPGSIIAAGIYVAIACYFLLRFAAGVALSRKLVRSSSLIREISANRKLSFRAPRAAPRLATSSWISIPVTVGAFRPVILLPSDWRDWDDAKFDAILAHELSHVARRDALTQHVSLLYRAVFWFNPLAWWLHRHLVTLAEQASDEAALSGGADQHHYARTLLGFFEVMQTAPRRIHWQGVSMARPGQAEQRLERILAWKGTLPMRVTRSFAATILILAAPVVYLTAAAHPASRSAVLGPALYQSAPSAPTEAPVGGVRGVPPVGGVPSVGPVAPMTLMDPSTTVPAIAPTAPVGNVFSQKHSGGFSYHYGFDDEERFVIVSGKSDSFTMSGSTQDARHAEKLKKQIPGDFIWFQRDEKSYIIRDQATIDRARALWAPQEELGKKQEELGKQQEALGKQQEALGNKMEQVRVNVPDMTAALDKLKAKLQKLGPTATMAQIGDLQSEIGELQSKIGEIQSQAGEQQGKLGELQGELGEKQGKLGEQQGELGRQQAELAEKAAREMKELLDDAIKNGTAKPEEETIRTPTL